MQEAILMIDEPERKSMYGALYFNQRTHSVARYLCCNNTDDSR